LQGVAKLHIVGYPLRLFLLIYCWQLFVQNEVDLVYL